MMEDVGFVCDVAAALGELRSLSKHDARNRLVAHLEEELVSELDWDEDGDICNPEAS